MAARVRPRFRQRERGDQLREAAKDVAAVVGLVGSAPSFIADGRGSLVGLVLRMRTVPALRVVLLELDLRHVVEIDVRSSTTSSPGFSRWRLRGSPMRVRGLWALLESK